LKYKNGNIQMLGMLVDSIPHGLWISFSPDGKISHFHSFFNGKCNGPVVGFYKNGKIRSYWYANKEGEMDGESKSFYDNGQIRCESFIINGSIHGLSKQYDKDGNIKVIREYDMGKFVRTIQGYDPDSEEAEEEYLKYFHPDDGEE
jgi:antitoxin component YwqK of YwqJK toxin-antitoxin module